MNTPTSWNTTGSGPGPLDGATPRAAVAQFLAETGQEIRFEIRFLDTIAEIAELTKEIAVSCETKEFGAETLRKRIEDELGDVSFCSIALGLKCRGRAADSCAYEPTRDVNLTGEQDISEGESGAIVARLHELIGALGRAAKGYLKATSYGQMDIEWAAEPLAPLLLELERSSQRLCETLGVKWSLVVEKSLEKYRRRILHGGTFGSESEPPPGLPSTDENAGSPRSARVIRSESCAEPTLEGLKFFAIELAIQGGKVARRYFRQPLTVGQKADSSPVTAADLETERLMRKLIQSRYPDHGIVGEELGRHPGSSRFSWVIDPIDGTKSFLGGAFDFGTIVALLDGESPILGVIYQPISGDLIVGDNHSATFNGRSARMRPCSALGDAVLLATDLLTVGRFQDHHGFTELGQRVKFARTWGNCVGYALLAGGFADIMVDPIVSPWDAMAVIPVIRGAGGIITDYFGQDPVKGKSLVACAPEIHAEVISLLNLPERKTRQ